jgi:hypothetical protein
VTSSCSTSDDDHSTSQSFLNFSSDVIAPQTLAELMKTDLITTELTGHSKNQIGGWQFIQIK